MGGIGNVMPELISHYQVYNGTNSLIGVTGEVEMPSLEAITESVELAGILGEINSPATGQYSSIKIKIPFAVLHEDVFALADTTKPVELTLRGSIQCTDPKTHITDYYPIKIVLKGKATTLNLGKLIKGKKGDPEIELEVYYIKIVINESTQLELDKLNFKFILHEKDMLEKIRKQVGIGA